MRKMRFTPEPRLAGRTTDGKSIFGKGRLESRPSDAVAPCARGLASLLFPNRSADSHVRTSVDKPEELADKAVRAPGCLQFQRHGADSRADVGSSCGQDPPFNFEAALENCENKVTVTAVDEFGDEASATGFVSKYQKGATVPTGNTEFQFKAGDLNFKSTSYDWLVVAGAKAKYKGSGTINGSGDFAFMLTATDGQAPGGEGSDRFRIKIWDKSGGGVVYDNQPGAPDDADATTALGGGSIMVHKP